MTRVRSDASPLPSGIGAELSRLRTILQRIAAQQLDRLLDLSSSGARQRRLWISLFVLTFATTAMCAHVLLQLQPISETRGPIELDRLPLLALLSGFRIILIIGIASMLALHMAGNFQADVFELKDVRTAWRFVSNLAAGRSPGVIRLREGRIVEADRKSPIVQIGGPGRVIVDYDTAALFEKPDGTPHIVGPDEGGASGAGDSARGATLEGFERLREPVISLRDQYIGNPAGQPLAVIGRSLDGMPIGVADVRGLFSVRRDRTSIDQASAVERPFPFRDRDIENLIYNQPVPVLTGEDHASGVPGDWTITMHGLIRDSLREFMSQNPLSEYLAGVGASEVERSELHADTILTKALQISSELPESGPDGQAATPKFHSRTELSGKFKKYESEFSTRAKEFGLELHWIGVGTWKMPDESSGLAVSQKHLEAWRMNRENAQRSDPQTLEQLALGTLLDEKLRLMQDVPISCHEKNRAKYSDKGVLMECLLEDFWAQLGEALDQHYQNGNPTPELEELEQAVLQLEKLLRVLQIGHVIGGETISRVRKRSESNISQDAPPAPATRAEGEKYQALLGKLEGNYRVAEAMIANEARRHANLSREQLITRIVERFERHGR